MEKKQETEPGPLDCLCNLSLEVEASSDSLVEESSSKIEFCQNCFVDYNPKLDKCKCNEGINKKNKKSKNVEMLESFTKKPARMNTKENATSFLEKRNILDFFNFLISHLLVKRPEDPIEFLITLLDDCMFFRAGLRKAPLLYDDTHLHGMVASFDPINHSYLTFEQYKTAFATLRLDNYNKYPPMNTENQIRGSFFITEANGLLTAHLASMVKIHKITTCDMEIFTYFFGPVGVLLAINLVLFASTARQLTCGLWKREDVKSTTERAALGRVCAKLVVVMGVTWVADVVSWAVGGPQCLWYITDLINALQGIFIFIVVGCQPQVWAAVKRIWCVKKLCKNSKHTTGAPLHSSSQGMPSMNDSVTNNTVSNANTNTTQTSVNVKIPMETVC